MEVISRISHSTGRVHISHRTISISIEAVRTDTTANQHMLLYQTGHLNRRHHMRVKVTSMDRTEVTMLSERPRFTFRLVLSNERLHTLARIVHVAINTLPWSRSHS